MDKYTRVHTGWDGGSTEKHAKSRRDQLVCSTSLSLPQMSLSRIRARVFTCACMYTRAQVPVHAGACVWDGGERLAKYGRVWPVCHAGTQPLASTKQPTRGVRGATIAGRNLSFIA